MNRRSEDQFASVLTAYIVAAAIATPLTGWLVDRFGLKNTGRSMTAEPPGGD